MHRDGERYPRLCLELPVCRNIAGSVFFNESSRIKFNLHIVHLFTKACYTLSFDCDFEKKIIEKGTA